MESTVIGGKTEKRGEKTSGFSMQGFVDASRTYGDGAGTEYDERFPESSYSELGDLLDTEGFKLHETDLHRAFDFLYGESEADEFDPDYRKEVVDETVEKVSEDPRFNDHQIRQLETVTRTGMVGKQPVEDRFWDVDYQEVFEDMDIESFDTVEVTTPTGGSMTVKPDVVRKLGDSYRIHDESEYTSVRAEGDSKHSREILDVRNDVPVTDGGKMDDIEHSAPLNDLQDVWTRGREEKDSEIDRVEDWEKLFGE